MRRDTDAARDFQRRGRESSAGWRRRAQERSRARALEEGRSSTLKQAARKRKAVVPKAVRRRVLRRSRGLCVCGCGRRATQLHHVLPEEKFPELALTEDNLVGVWHDCHARHENAFVRLPREVLPACAIRLARSHPRYETYLERTYPAYRGSGVVG